MPVLYGYGFKQQPLSKNDKNYQNIKNLLIDLVRLA